MSAPDGIQAITLLRSDAQTDTDWVAIEEPLEIIVEYPQRGEHIRRSAGITMRTPGDDIALARGLAFCEGLIDDVNDLVAIESCGPPVPPHGQRNIVKVQLRAEPRHWIERYSYMSSACGICGKPALEALTTNAAPAASFKSVTIARDVLLALPLALRERQSLFGRTGGLHACALFDTGGQLIDCREDIGRHNALDKLIGQLLLRRASETSSEAHILMLSGRISFELVQKAVRAGIATVCAVGAPSSLAIRLAQQHGLTLIGFLREGRYNLYCGTAVIST